MMHFEKDGEEMADVDSGCKSREVRTALIIPTLCRDKHLKKCLESLKRNPWARYVDLYIGLDYPLHERHRPGYENILKILEGDFSMFRSFHLFKRETNYGAIRNTKDLFQEVISTCDQLIYSEDDNEFSENYLEYMLKTLEYFRDDPEVIAVTGYAYPVRPKGMDGCSVITQNAIFNAWGVGFWKDKYLAITKEIVEERFLIRDYFYITRNCKLSRYRRTDYLNCVAGVDPDDPDTEVLCPMFTRITDISMSVYMQVKGLYQAMPVMSKVRNNGFDGTGVFCQKIDRVRNGKRRITSDTFYYGSQRIDQKKDFVLVYDGGKSRQDWYRVLDRFVEPGAGMRVRAALKKTAVRLFGRKAVWKMRKWRKKG